MSVTFDRVVCGVDGSEAGETAAQLAARIAAPDGSFTLVAADDSSIAVHAGWQMAAIAEELLHDAEVALERGRAIAEPVHPVETRLVEGDPRHCLMAEVERRDATLAVVGTHIRSRALGIALGSVSTHLLHEAPCSVLIARDPRDAEAWPRSLVVGLDGSREAAAALAVARELGERFGASVREVEAAGDPVAELVELSSFTDLIVVGSRGVKGIRALGSVSERIAHEARCPVLVVRSRDREETHDESA